MQQVAPVLNMYRRSATLEPFCQPIARPDVLTSGGDLPGRTIWRGGRNEEGGELCGWRQRMDSVPIQPVRLAKPDAQAWLPWLVSRFG